VAKQLNGRGTFDVQKALSGAKFPSSKQDLIQHARINDVDGEISGPDQVQNAVFRPLLGLLDRLLDFLGGDLTNRLPH
jgi:hypothetical protein